jgi:hypothetical protein
MLDHAQASAALRRTVRAPLRVWMVPVLWLAYGLRCISLGNSDLWLDEAVSYFVARKPLPEILAYSATNVREHPPGYYVGLHLWMLVAGQSEFALRFLAVMGGVLSVALVAVLARRWFGDRIALLAAVLMAVQPMAAQYSREARMYTWAIAAVLLGVYLLDRAIRRNRWRDWVLFAAVTLATLSLHYLTILLLLAYGLFLVIRWRGLAGRWRLAGILGFLVLIPLGWIVLLPGPRDTALSTLGEGLRTGWSLARLEPVYTRSALGGAADTMQPALAIVLASASWLLVLLGIVAMPQPRGQSRRTLQWLLASILIVPPLVASFLFVVMIGRHYSFTLGLFTIGLVLGGLALFRRSRALGIAVLAALLAYNSYLCSGNLFGTYRPFSPAMEYATARAYAGEPLVYTHFFEWVLNSYYNRADLPAYYIPDSDIQLSVRAATRRAADVLDHNSSAWLMLFPGLLNTERVEEAFDALAYPAEKVWFPGGRGVVHYFAARPLTEHPGNMTWKDQIGLTRWWISGDTVAGGDALRLEFEWQRLRPVKGPVLVALTLVGPDKTVWATRVGEPCNGRCPTSAWADSPVVDRQALDVPSDIPPGEYELRIAWLGSDGDPTMGRLPGQALAQKDLPLAVVRVDPPSSGVAVSPPMADRLNVDFGKGLVLQGAELDDVHMQGGETLVLPLQWSVQEPQSPLALELRLERIGWRYAIQQPIGPAWYPSEAWTPGRSVKVQPQFAIPGSLPPATYRASVAVIETDTGSLRGQARLGALTIIDRPHRYDVPSDGAVVDQIWSEGIALLRVKAPESALPGDALPLTLVWQAQGPTQRNWKVFVHLLDAYGTVWAQGDGYPADSGAATPTWREGEVIVDNHVVDLPPDLPAGSYTVRVGFYDENTGERLPQADGSDSFTLPAPLVIGNSQGG